MTSKGINESTYLTLGGIEQYVLIRGSSEENPVIIYLHGGPSGPDTFVTYGFTDYLIDKYTVIAWDQRGCGRTYYHNIKNDPENKSADFEQAKEDLDDLVDYALDRFGRKQVIILGHSYGSVLGSQYALWQPDKVSAYIGTGQLISFDEANKYCYEDALKKAKSSKDDTAELTKAYEALQDKNENPMLNMLKLRSLVSRYYTASIPDKSFSLSLASPYLCADDLRWFIKQVTGQVCNMDGYINLNRQLFEYTFSFDAYKYSLKYEMPVYFISGSCDYVCPVDSIKKYADSISAPDVCLKLIEGCGHNVQFSSPKEYAQCVKDLLSALR